MASSFQRSNARSRVGVLMVGIQFDAILPEQFRSGTVRLYLLTEARKIARDLRKDFEATVQTWNRKPEFETIVSLAGGSMTVGCETDDEIYGYVNYGTQTHFVFPVRKKALKFPGVYYAKSTPGVLGASQGGGGGAEFAKYAWVRGIEPRDFEGTIKNKWEDEFERRFQEALEVAADRTGYGLD